jgi:hypothetical protein
MECVLVRIGTWGLIPLRILPEEQSKQKETFPELSSASAARETRVPCLQQGSCLRGLFAVLVVYTTVPTPYVGFGAKVRMNEGGYRCHLSWPLPYLAPRPYTTGRKSATKKFAASKPPDALWAETGILSDTLVETLASAGPINVSESLMDLVGYQWRWYDDYQEEFLNILKSIPRDPIPYS